MEFAMTQIDLLGLAHPRTAKRRVGLLARLAAWRAVRRQRADLSRLDDYRLEDIGLTRADVARETARPLWDVPERWLR